jgi:hypothetical protein
MLKLLDKPKQETPPETPEVSPVLDCTQNIFIALPCYPISKEEAAQEEEEKDRLGHNLIHVQRPTSQGRIKTAKSRMSLLNRNFNKLWCRSRNLREQEGITHFAMLHQDVTPIAGWAQIMINELNRTGADIISTVLPIKDKRGLTSTGIRDPMNGHIRRFTMREIFELPETFGIEEVREAGLQCGQDNIDSLVINTGCWVCKFTDDWVRKFTGFRSIDGIKENPDGTCEATVLPEDWYFSEWLARRNLKVLATRKVIAVHFGAGERDPYGPNAYRNDSAWGEWVTDQGDDPCN